MTANLYLMPVLALLAGAISLFVDPRDPQKKKLIYALLLLMLLTCAFQIYFGYVDQQQVQKERLNIEESTNILVTLAGYGYSSDQLVTVLQQASAHNPDINALPKVQQSSKAAEELKMLGSPQPERQGHVTIEYFPRDVDAEKVRGALENLGFIVKPGNTQYPEVPTNAVWFGNQVTANEVKRVAYVLIRAGVQIKAIRRFEASAPSQDALLIQVGGDPQLVSKPTMTVEQIRNAPDFPRAM